MKKIINVFIAFCLISTMSVPLVTASYDDYAVYLSNGMYMSSATITGNVYAVGGDVRFSGAGDNLIDGNVYYSDGNEVIYENKYSMPKITGEVSALPSASFDSNGINSAQTPEIVNYVNSLTCGWSNVPTVSEDTHFGALSITNKLVVDTSNGDVTIVVDSFEAGNIEIVGDGVLNLYVGGDFALNNGKAINKTGNPSSVNFFVDGSVSIGGGCSLYGSIYASGEKVSLSGGGKIYGNVVSGAESVAFGGNTEIYGKLYVPSAEVVMNGSAKLYGRLCAKSLNIIGSARISNKNVTVDIPILDSAISGDASEDEPEKNPDYGKPIALSNDFSYIFGRSNTKMEPNDEMLRGEAAAVLYRLLKQNDKLGDFVYRSSNKPCFSDITGRWDRSAIEYMVYIGVYDGDSSKPINASGRITRAETFKLFSLALGFTDDKSSTPERYAKIMVDEGYVTGYGDGDLGLDRYITRAEYCKVYNLIIGRDEMSLMTADGSVVTSIDYGFTDLDGEWYTDIMLKATSAYDENGFVDFEKRALRNVLDDYADVG